MSKQELSKDVKKQIKKLQELISDIKENGAYDVLYLAAIAGAESPKTRSTEAVASKMRGCHISNATRLSALLQYRARKLQDIIFSEE